MANELHVLYALDEDGDPLQILHATTDFEEHTRFVKRPDLPTDLRGMTLNAHKLMELLFTPEAQQAGVVEFSYDLPYPRVRAKA